MKAQMKKSILGIISLCLGIMVSVAVYYDMFSYTELMYEDFFYQREDVIDNKIKIVAIDDRTLSQYGEYGEWSRQIYADLVNVLNAEDNPPKVIAFDIIFPNNKDEQGDMAFAEACSNGGNVVVASKLAVSACYDVEQNAINTYHVTDYQLPYEALQMSTKTGFANIILDNDGYVRHALYSLTEQDQYYESFSNVICSSYLESMGRSSEAENLSVTATKPINSFLIDYTAKPGSYEMISMADVLDGTVPASVFDGCIVLIGSCTEGLQDSFGTPIDRRSLMYGVEINANIVQAILEERHIEYANRWLTAILSGAFAGLFCFFVSKRRIVTMTIAFLCGVLGHFLLCMFLIQKGIILVILYQLAALVLVYFGNLIWKYINEKRLRTKEMRELLFSMAEAMTQAIDERTPYNASHTRKVAEYAVSLAKYINEQRRRRRTKLCLTNNEIDQLHLAALLHDVGKLDVPLEILDKPSKLGQSMETLMTRLQIISLELEVRAYEKRMDEEEKNKDIEMLNKLRDYIMAVNAKEWISEEERATLEEFKQFAVPDEAGVMRPVLTEREYECLAVKKGTLTQEEMEQVHEHVVYTDKILSKITFGYRFQNVKRIAASHHEFLNGAGYPKQLNAEELSTEVRILTIADIYDALTADDRPYKRAKTREESFKILHFMQKDGQVDGEILAFAEELWK